MSDWPVGLSTGCFYRRSILDCLASIRDAGFSTIEVCSFPAHLDYHDRHAVRRTARRFRELNLEPYSFHAPFADHIDITALEADRRRRSIEEIARAAESASELGARYFVIHPGPERGGFLPPERMRRMESAAAAIDQIAERCRSLGTHLVLENMLPHLFSGHVRDLLWLLGALDDTGVGICLDTGHALLSGDLPTAVAKLSGHLSMVHASDNHGAADDHLAPGDGIIDWVEIARSLSRCAFGGALILEISGDIDATTVLETAQRGRRFLRELCRRLDREQEAGPNIH